MRNREPRSRRAGFTLIEVLLVLAILLILAALAVPNLSKIFKGSQVKAAKAQISQLENTIEAYHFDMNAYPATLDALLAAPAGVDATGWNGPYVKKQQNLMDPWNKPFQYACPGGHGEFDLWTESPEGVMISNWE